MKTKVEILKDHGVVTTDTYNPLFELVKNAMDDYARQQCKEQRNLCSYALTVDIPLSPTHNLILFAPEPNFL